MSDVRASRPLWWNCSKWISLSLLWKPILPWRTVPAGQKQPSTQERVAHWECGLCWILGHEGEQAGPQGWYSSPFSHCRAAENAEKPRQWSTDACNKSTGRHALCGVWHTTKLLGPPSDVNPSAVAFFSIGGNGCAETLTVPAWVTTVTHTNIYKCITWTGHVTWTCYCTFIIKLLCELIEVMQWWIFPGGGSNEPQIVPKLIVMYKIKWHFLCVYRWAKFWKWDVIFMRCWRN